MWGEKSSSFHEEVGKPVEILVENGMSKDYVRNTELRKIPAGGKKKEN